jgi:hypothetical protein
MADLQIEMTFVFFHLQLMLSTNPVLRIKFIRPVHVRLKMDNVDHLPRPMTNLKN